MPKANPNNIYLKQLEVSGYRSIQKASTTLERGLNIIIGKNAAGKTNFLECLSSAIRSQREVQYSAIELVFIDFEDREIKVNRERIQKLKDHTEEPTESPRRVRQTNFHQTVFLNGDLIYDSNERELQVGAEKFKVPPNLSLNFLFRNLNLKGLPQRFIRFNIPPGFGGLETPFNLFAEVYEEQYISQYSNQITTTYLDSILNKLGLAIDGTKPNKITEKQVNENLTINKKISSQLKKYSVIKNIRFSKNINIYQDDKSARIENIYLEFYVNNRWMPWSALSDGTRRLFYLITEIASIDHGLILIEEPELGIHPHQFHLIMNFILEESASKQIIMSTHSPQALDSLNENELTRIIICELDQEKGTILRHLTNSEIKKARKYIDEVGFLSDYWLMSDLEHD